MHAPSTQTQRPTIFWRAALSEIDSTAETMKSSRAIVLAGSCLGVQSFLRPAGNRGCLENAQPADVPAACFMHCVSAAHATLSPHSHLGPAVAGNRAWRSVPFASQQVRSGHVLEY